ncbi:hypothetical protein BCV72DRAFT_198665, partial [Rhizopus microsporus var. microsporus]
RATENRLTAPKGIVSSHYLRYIDNTIDIMDEFSECMLPEKIGKEKVHICVSCLFIHSLNSFRVF